MENNHKYTAIKGQELVLTYKIRQPLVKTTNPGLLILLHGVGSNEDDLFRFTDTLPPHFIVVSARAPYTICPGRYAWFRVDFSSGKPVIDPEQAEKSRQVLNLFTSQLMERYEVNPTEVYMGGFSQGGIMSYSTGLTHPQKFKGIFILSSRLLPEVKPLINPGPALQKLRVFIAHGIADQVLPLPHAHEAKAYLDNLTPDITYHEYRIGHQVDTRELADLNNWLLS